MVLLLISIIHIYIAFWVCMSGGANLFSHFKKLESKCFNENPNFPFKVNTEEHCCISLLTLEKSDGGENKDNFLDT